MTAFNSSINVIAANIAVPDMEDGKLADELEVILTVGQIFAMPNMPQPVVVPLGQLRFSLDRDAATQLSEGLQKASEKLRQPSKLDVASNMAEVEDAAKRLSSLDQSVKDAP